MAEIVKVVMTGRINIVWPITMAFWVYSRSMAPRIPFLEIKAYTRIPMTTVGSASRVFSTVISSRFPGKELKAMVNPRGSPIRLDRNVEAPLTFRDTATIDSISGSREKIRSIADRKLSVSKSIIVLPW